MEVTSTLSKRDYIKFLEYINKTKERLMGLGNRDNKQVFEMSYSTVSIERLMEKDKRNNF